MSATDTPAVLHVTAAVGGGVDRYIRDAAATTSRRHFIWHAGDAIDVIEDVAARSFVPLRDAASAPGTASAIDSWRRAEGVGLVHAHGVEPAVGARLALTAPSLPVIATLHDVGFIAPNAFAADAMPSPDAAWIADIARMLARVETLIAPSAFIHREAQRVFPDKPIVDIAPGIARRAPVQSIATPAEFGAREPRHVVAVVGAIGPHKGVELVDAIARALAPRGIALVVIGYTSERLRRGWSGEHFVHGPYRADELPALFACYGVEIVLFPNRLPESFSYTLSEAWAAGIPAIVPDAGALGERVLRHGGGWRLPARFAAQDAASLITRLFDADGDAELARVKSQIDPNDADRIPTLASMSRALERLYERFAVPVHDSGARIPVDALAPLLAANLDGFAFRAELLNLAEDLDNARTAIAELTSTLEGTRQWASSVESAAAEARAWTQKLERDIEAQQREIEIRDAALRALPAPLRVWLTRRALRARR